MFYGTFVSSEYQFTLAEVIVIRLKYLYHKVNARSNRNIADHREKTFTMTPPFTSNGGRALFGLILRLDCIEGFVLENCNARIALGRRFAIVNMLS